MLILASDDKGGIYSKLQGIGSRDIPFGIDDADREFKDLKLHNSLLYENYIKDDKNNKNNCINNMEQTHPIINSDIWNFEFDESPFKHVTIDNFLNKEFADDILDELNTLTKDKSYYYGNQNIEKNKYAFKSNLKNNLTRLFEELNSDAFISMIEHKTGISGIIRHNLNLQGAGVHKIFNEGFLCMHTDFEGYYDPQYGMLDRRINLLLYMNKDWKDDYGGHLCLYDREQGKITKRVLPLFNRCVIFATPDNIHGHPTPLEIPEDVARQSITTYYYTKNISGKNLKGGDIQPVTWYHDIKDYL